MSSNWPAAQAPDGPSRWAPPPATDGGAPDPYSAPFGTYTAPPVPPTSAPAPPYSAQPGPYGAPAPYTGPPAPYATRPDPYGAPAPYTAPTGPYGAPAPHGVATDPFGSPAEFHGAPRPGAQPSYAVPLPQYGAQPGYYAPRQLGTNGFAIASLVLGLLGGTVLAVILGHVAISQINRTGQEGKGMAIAGLVLGYAWLAITILFVIAALSAPSTYSSY